MQPQPAPATQQRGETSPHPTLSDVPRSESSAFDGHERVVRCHDSASGLRAFIAIHNTTRGPALGGVRLWSYSSEADALYDALRLSKAMSYKHAVADLPRGGGKAVIFSAPSPDQREAQFRAFGRCVHALAGKYITAADVGISTPDMIAVRQETPYVAGLPIESGGSGDPSPMTAYGVFCGLRAAVAYRRGATDWQSFPLDGLTVAVQGLGHVGYNLCRHLHGAGARLVVADLDPSRVERAVSEFGATAVETEAIYEAEADVFAPCALGGALSRDTVPRLRAQIVAGAANNQLASPEVGGLLQARGILYAPDYVINAGGVINISYESNGYDAASAQRHTTQIGQTLTEIFARAEREGVSTAVIADFMAREKLVPT